MIPSKVYRMKSPMSMTHFNPVTNLLKCPKHNTVNAKKT